MSKVVKTLVSVAAIAAVGMATGGFGFTLAGAQAFAGTTFGRLMASVALSSLAQALAAPKSASGEPAGIRTTQTMTGGTNAETFVLGLYATGGQLVAPPMSHGTAGQTPNAYLTYVIELGGIPGQTLEGLILDGQAAPILTASPHADYGQRIGGRFLDRAWIRYHDGTQTAADPMLLAKYGSASERPWSASMIGAGLNYAVLTFRYDREVFQGFPSARFVMGGIPLYDPRKDSTAGGSGSQRWANPATWVSSRNAAVQTYNILRGLRLPGGHVWGGEATAADLPYLSWSAAMDACDLTVDGQAQYRTGLEVSVDDEPFAVIEALLAGCSGQIAEAGGVWDIQIGAPRLPVYFFDDDDIIVTEGQSFEPFPAPTAVYNGVSASYPDPDSLWESRDAPPLASAEWEAEDGGRRLMANLALETVPYPGQVQRLQAALAADNRRWRRHVLSLPWDAAHLLPLDTVAWSSQQNFYGAKLFEVVECSRELRGGLVQVSLRERDPDDYSPGAVILPAPPNTNPLLPVVQAVPGWDAQGFTYQDHLGRARRPAVRYVWSTAAADDATGIRTELRVAGTSTVVAPGIFPVAAGGAILLDVLSATDYEARARIIADRPTQWTAWTALTTPPTRLTALDVDSPYDPGQVDEINDRLDDLEEWIETPLTGINDRLEAEIAERISVQEEHAAAIADLAMGGLAQFDKAVIWYHDTSVEGWSGSPNAPAVIAAGWLRPGAGSWCASPTGLGINGVTYGQVRLRLRKVGAPTWLGQMWWRAAAGTWDASRRVSVPEPEWVDGIANLTVTPAWAGVIDQIRLDLASGADASNYIEIDWTAIGRPAPGASTAEVVSEKNARISADNALSALISALSTRMTDAETGLIGQVTAVDALEGRVTTAEGKITAQGSQLTSLTTTVSGKASTSALNAVTTRVTAAEGDINALAEDITSLSATVAGKASSTAVSALQTRMSSAEGNITSLQSSLTSLTTTVNGKASTSALNALTTRMTAAEDDIEAQSDALTSLNSTVGKFSASGLFRITTESTPSGAQSRIGLKAAATNGEGQGSRSAALFLEARSGGKSRVLIQADQFAVINGSASAFPFLFEDGVARMNVAHIGTITAGVIRSGNFEAGDDGAGTLLRLSDGYMELNNVKIRRQIEVASGEMDLGRIPSSGSIPSSASGGGSNSDSNPDWAMEYRCYWVRSTPIPISAWGGGKKTYIATVQTVAGTINYPSGAEDSYWGWKADVFPLTDVDGGNQSLRLRLGLWTRKVNYVSGCKIRWKIYEVS